MTTTDHRIFRHAVSDAGILVDANPEWFAFAVENGATRLVADCVLGRPLWDFLSGSEMRHLYQVVMDRLKESGSPVRLRYRCDSPDCRRKLQMDIHYLPGSGGYRFDNRILEMQQREPVGLLDPTRTRGRDMLRMCGWCKKVLLADGRWVEPEEAINSLGLFEAQELPRITHGICPACSEYVLAELARS